MWKTGTKLRSIPLSYRVRNKLENTWTHPWLEIRYPFVDSSATSKIHFVKENMFPLLKKKITWIKTWGKILLHTVNLLSSESETDKVTNANKLPLSRAMKGKQNRKEFFNLNLSSCYLSVNRAIPHVLTSRCTTATSNLHTLILHYYSEYGRIPKPIQVI